MKGYYKLVTEQLATHGYHYLRAAKGAHEAWTNGVRIQILSRNISSRHTANGIMKQAGIAHRF